MMNILSIVGARPQFIKLAPLVQTLKNCEGKHRHVIVHTGQHYDFNMSKIFFKSLGIPNPHYHLNSGSGRHGAQTGKMLNKIERVLIKEAPDWIIVFGDTNTTLAGALAASKLHMPIAHIEAGLRSYNKKMPEEINRILTDHCSTVLFCPTEHAVENLKMENFSNIAHNGQLINDPASQDSYPDNNSLVVNVGDIMYDSLLLCLDTAEKKSSILKKLALKPKEYCLATVHRAENTDDETKLRSILDALAEAGKNIPIIFPIHPRTRKKVKALKNFSSHPAQLRFIDPVDYLDMLILEKNAQKILTDSGGMQKEAYFLNVPCITLRNETEWTETIECGGNILVGTEKKSILNSINGSSGAQQMDLKNKLFFGDGKTAAKIISILQKLS